MASLETVKEELVALKATSLETDAKFKDIKASVKEVADTLHCVVSDLTESNEGLSKETSTFRADIKTIDTSGSGNEGCCWFHKASHRTYKYFTWFCLGIDSDKRGV